MKSEYGKDKYKLVWLYERCKSEKCLGRRVNTGFSVPDAIWEQVAPTGVNILCLTCFDEYAQQKGVAYRDVLEVFLPLTWEDGLKSP